MDNTAYNQSDEVKISEFGLVAALLTSGFGIRRTEKVGRRVLFIFGSSEDLQQTIDDYWAGTLKVYARQIMDNSKMLKSMIYDGRQQ